MEFIHGTSKLFIRLFIRPPIRAIIFNVYFNHYKKTPKKPASIMSPSLQHVTQPHPVPFGPGISHPPASLSYMTGVSGCCDDAICQQLPIEATGCPSVTVDRLDLRGLYLQVASLHKENNIFDPTSFVPML